ncbi:TetR/AcrR family transcriptional regulator [Mumia sp. ZJ1417]|uniref:TetR/AcrR family transcriptional regulator n=1 Tax=Mumia sp. ZJ1417 TaxID=2708082 RepID=UPI0014241FE8|nr:TetR/AcrR family transcriptional regulator [Mumia sp. ZJ1417]QMW65326.1 TetR/AcrR family transcriptional regulator [Mumia sp. ZJ1417]
MESAIGWTPKARAVLAAASELFYSQGIHAVGVDAIAEHAGVTKKTLYDRFGSKDRLVVEYLVDREQRWRDFLLPRLEAAGTDPASRLAAIFDAVAIWSGDHGGKGCSMINAHAEISDPSHPAYAVIIEQKRWTLALFADLARDSGAADPGAVAEDLMILHEGAMVTAGMGIVPSAYDRAREAALRRLRAG